MSCPISFKSFKYNYFLKEENGHVSLKVQNLAGRLMYEVYMTVEGFKHTAHGLGVCLSNVEDITDKLIEGELKLSNKTNFGLPRGHQNRPISFKLPVIKEAFQEAIKVAQTTYDLEKVLNADAVNLAGYIKDDLDFFMSASQQSQPMDQDLAEIQAVFETLLGGEIDVNQSIDDQLLEKLEADARINEQEAMDRCMVAARSLQKIDYRVETLLRKYHSIKMLIGKTCENDKLRSQMLAPYAHILRDVGQLKEAGALFFDLSQCFSEHDRAVKYGQLAIKCNPHCVHYYNHLAELHRKAGSLDAAANTCLMGAFYFQKTNPERAIDFCHTANQLNPFSGEAIESYEAMLILHNKTDKLIQHYQDLADALEKEGDAPTDPDYSSESLYQEAATIRNKIARYISAEKLDAYFKMDTLSSTDPICMS